MQVIKIILVLAMFACESALSQTVEVMAKPLTDADIQLLRSDLQADKNQIITHAMQFTDSESAAFWPIYRDFVRDQQEAADERLQLMKDYAQKCDVMDDVWAKDLTQRFLSVEAKFLNLRQGYWPKFEKALGAKRAAKFYQVDNRLGLLINLQLASEIPLLR